VSRKIFTRARACRKSKVQVDSWLKIQLFRFNSAVGRARLVGSEIVSDSGKDCELGVPKLEPSLLPIPLSGHRVGVGRQGRGSPTGAKADPGLLIYGV
jgi:hypothetical protein